MTDRNLSQWLTYMGSIHVSAIDMGLERVLPVAKRLGVLKADLKKKPTIFTVAGTNGKGSTTATIAAICQSAGLKTALYQSPHLVSFTERVRIDGIEASDEALILAFEAVESARLAEGLSLSFFEMTTLAAFWLFKQADCDVWVLEIGLGGRLDVVNIIDPDVAVITNIGIDHVDWLGDDIEKIGAEKAGIIREGIPVILGDENLPRSVTQIAKQYNAKVYQLGVDYDYLAKSDGWIWSSASLTAQLPLPKLSLQNAVNAAAAILASNLGISLDAIKHGLSVVQLAGRFDQRVIHDRQWIFDVAHNEDGIKFLLKQLTRAWQRHLVKHPDAKLYFLFSMLGDKDVSAVLHHLKAAMDANELPMVSWHMAAIDHSRAMPLDELLGITQRYVDPVQISTYETLDQAAHGVIDASRPEDLIVAFGSFHTIGESLVALLGRPY